MNTTQTVKRSTSQTATTRGEHRNARIRIRSIPTDRRRRPINRERTRRHERVTINNHEQSALKQRKHGRTTCGRLGSHSSRGNRAASRNANGSQRGRMIAQIGLIMMALSLRRSDSACKRKNDPMPTTIGREATGDDVAREHASNVWHAEPPKKQRPTRSLGGRAGGRSYVTDDLEHF